MFGAQIASAGLPNSPVLEGEPKGKPIIVSFDDKDITARYADLNGLNFVDPNLEAQINKNIVGANVLVDVPQAVVKLTLETTPCYNVEICPAVMIYKTIELPVISAAFDNCGIKTIVAEVNKLAVDGGRETIIVKDNTQNVCPTLIALAETEVIYETQSSGFVSMGFPPAISTSSTFSGEELLPLLP